MVTKFLSKHNQVNDLTLAMFLGERGCQEKVGRRGGRRGRKRGAERRGRKEEKATKEKEETDYNYDYDYHNHNHYGVYNHHN